MGAILAGVAPRVAMALGDRARLRGVLAWAGLGAIVADISEAAPERGA